MEQTLLHKCGLCNQSFNTEETYTQHTCSVTGVTPTHPDHFGAEFKAVSEGALIRGQLKRQLMEANLSADQADILSSNVATADDAEKILSAFSKKQQSNAI